VTTFSHPTKLERKQKLVVYKECEEISKAETNEKFPEGPFFNTMTKCKHYSATPFRHLSMTFS